MRGVLLLLLSNQISSHFFLKFHESSSSWLVLKEVWEKWQSHLDGRRRRNLYYLCINLNEVCMKSWLPQRRQLRLMMPSSSLPLLLLPLFVSRTQKGSKRGRRKQEPQRETSGKIGWNIFHVNVMLKWTQKFTVILGWENQEEENVGHTRETLWYFLSKG